jgi:DNA repair protein RecO (recombination protein O)
MARRPVSVRSSIERTLVTPALLVRRVDVGDADVMATLFTRERGLVSASARRARAPKSRLGPLEPLHTLRVVIDITARSDVGRLKEASLLHPRLHLLEETARIDAASQILRWVRTLAPSNVPEPGAFDLVEAALDHLADTAPAAVDAVLGATGLSLAAAFGYRLELEACVRCGTPCPKEASALIDPAAGGVVCRACGGGPVLVRAPVRLSLGRALRGEGLVLTKEEAAAAVDLATRTIDAHARPRAASRSK